MSTKVARVVESGKVVARRGSGLFCPNPDCRAGIATFRRDLLAGAPDIGVDLFLWASGQARIAGDGATCHVCKTVFMREVTGVDQLGAYVKREFFTQHGWVAYLLPRPGKGPYG